MNESLQAAHGLAAAAARHDFGAFLAYVGIDEQGDPFLRRELDTAVWEFAEECFESNEPCGLMLPMGAGKTTLACYRAAYEMGRDPNVLVSIVSYSADRAAILVGTVRSIVRMPTYRTVFPHVRVRSRQDMADRFTIERTGVSNNPSVSGCGILTGTGVRTSFLILDDIVTLKNALQEPANRRRVLEAVRTTWMSRQQLRGAGRRCTVWLQTAYHQSDAAAVLRTDSESTWRWMIVRAEEPYEALTWEKWARGACAEEGELPCPFPAARLRQRAAQMGPTGAARGLANRAVSDEICPFREQYFDGPPPAAPNDYRRRIVFADPAGDATKARSGNTDYCAVVAIGYQNREKCWEVFMAERMRGSPSQQANFIARKAVQAGVNVVWQEAVRDEALVGVTQRALRDMDAPISVKPVKPTTNKELRVVQTLEPAMAVDPPLLRVCGERFLELKNEALAFPVGAHDDLIDALAGAFAKVRTPALYLGGAVRGEPVRETLLDRLIGHDPRESADHPEHEQWKADRAWEGYSLNDPDELSAWSERPGWTTWGGVP